MDTKHLASTCLALAVLATSAMAQSQELYTLSRFNTIWRIDGYDTAAPSPVLVTTWAPPTGTPIGGASPLGLDRDPVTGEFLLLIGSWQGGTGTNAQIVRVDPMTGTSTLELEVPHDSLFGLHRRWDNKFVSIDGRESLVIIDPTDGSTTVTPLASTAPDSGSLFNPFTLDLRGFPQILGDTSGQVDPVTGALQPAVIPDRSNLPFAGVALANSGDVYAATVFPGDLYRFDEVADQWQVIFDQGVFFMNNVYDFVLTESETGLGFGQVCEGTPNATGRGATLELLGVSDVAANDLRLITRNLPGVTAGMYLMGSTAGAVPVGSGTLCISPTVFRYTETLSLVQDTFAFTADLTMLPNGQPAMANTTQIFQYWYRTVEGGMPSSNLSDAVSVSFR